MAASFRIRYKDQLPRLRRWSWETAMNLASFVLAVISTIALWNWDRISSDNKSAILIFVLLSLVCLLFIWIVIISKKGMNRYAQSVFYVHYVNHAIRDYLSELRKGTTPPLQDYLADILFIIAFCFSVVTGRQCRCSVKDLTKNMHVVTRARDAMSRAHYAETSSVIHDLSQNSDFESLWYGKDGCVRYFFGPNLVALWKERKYKNSSFKIHGEPEIFSVFGFTHVKNWRLPYKSTIVWPIRFIPDYTQWPRPSKNHQCVPESDSGVRPHFLGFLCIDCASTDVFDLEYCPELGAAFADALYTLFTQSQFIREKMERSGVPVH